MLSVLVPVYLKGPARLLAMGSICGSGGVVLTRTLSCKVSCQIPDATLSSLRLCGHILNQPPVGQLFALPSSLLRFLLCGTLPQALAATPSSWATRAVLLWMVFFGGVNFCRALAPVAEAGVMTTRTITLLVAW